MSEKKLSNVVVEKLDSFVGSVFELTQEGLKLLKKQHEVFDEFLTYCKTSKAKGVKDVEPLKVVTAWLHSNHWPVVRDKALGINKVEDNILRVAKFAETGELIESSLDKIQMSHYQGIQFYHGLRKYLAYKRKTAYMALINEHADTAEQRFQESDEQTPETVRHILFTQSDDCITEAVKSGLVSDNETARDKVETDFFVAAYERGLAVESDNVEDAEEDTAPSDEDVEQAEAILRKSDVNLAKAFAKLIDDTVEDDKKAEAFEAFEHVCSLIRSGLYDESIQDLG